MIGTPARLRYKPRSSNLTRKSLANIRRKLIRAKAWFRLLTSAEKGIIDLTIKCVERVRSARLAKILERILVKVSEVLKSQFLHKVHIIGEPLASEVSRIAYSWGNSSAEKWARDFALVMYLGVMQINASATPSMLQPER